MLCLGAIVDLTARALGRRLPLLLGPAIALALVAIWPIRESFVEGQLNIPVAAGIVACWYALRVGRPGLAGVALALAVALKPLAGLFVLWALWRRQWRLLFAAGATLIGVHGASASRSRASRAPIDYVTLAYPMHAQLWPGYQDNASPQGLFTRLFGPSDWRPRPPYPTPGPEPHPDPGDLGGRGRGCCSGGSAGEQPERRAPEPRVRGARRDDAAGHADHLAALLRRAAGARSPCSWRISGSGARGAGWGCWRWRCSCSGCRATCTTGWSGRRWRRARTARFSCPALLAVYAVGLVCLGDGATGADGPATRRRP